MWIQWLGDQESLVGSTLDQTSNYLGLVAGSPLDFFTLPYLTDIHSECDLIWLINDLIRKSSLIQYV